MLIESQQKRYAQNLEHNLLDLHTRLKEGRYIAPPVMRVWIKKEDGKERPIGIPAFEDKIVKRRCMEDDRTSYPDKGTPQGGVVFPILSNIFLHYVLDDWFVKAVLPWMKGRCFIIRWADDFIIGCQRETDAHRLMDVLPKRFGSYDLSLHPEKTILIPFSKPPASIRKDNTNGNFNFLGFTCYWAKSLKGYWVIKKKTAGKRVNRFMKI